MAVIGKCEDYISAQTQKRMWTRKAIDFKSLLRYQSGNIKMPNGFFGQNLQVENWILPIRISLQSWTKYLEQSKEIQ